MSIRVQLFSLLQDSPVSKETTDFEIASIITPESKTINNEDTEHDVLTPLSVDFTVRNATSSSRGTRRSLFSGKRPAEDDLSGESPTTKRLRELFDEHTIHSQEIIEAVERLESRDLIADGSRAYTLPTIPGKHGDLKSITAETMVDVVNGKYTENFGKVTIVDCRYPYEFEGGHIKGAVNMYTKDQVHSLLQTSSSTDKPHVLIFHCEFSSERGPKMYRFLRSQDREMNKQHYPRLNFPEVYLLHNGYKAFYQSSKELCDPINYKPMLHEDHSADLRHFRIKSKSWTAGEKQVTSRRSRSRLSRNLSFQ
ncbi:M-phase inducer phosphatase 1 [Mactra antiquata]